MSMQLKVSSKNGKDGKEYFEGTVTFCGLRPTKLTKNDGSTKFSNRAGVMNAAKNVSTKLNLQFTETENKSLKKAAKRSVKKSETPAKTCTSSCTESNQ